MDQPHPMWWLWQIPWRWNLQAGSCRRARNFTSDIKDSEIYTELLCQVITSLPSLSFFINFFFLLLKMFADRPRWSWCGQERYGEKTLGGESRGLIKICVRFWWQVEQCDDEVTMPAMVTKQSGGYYLPRRCCAKRTRWDAGSLSPPRLSFFSLSMKLDMKTSKI